MKDLLTPQARREFEVDPFATKYRAFVFFALLFICAFSRLWDLGSKSMMHDELLFAQYTFHEMYENFSYYYQPILHGPASLLAQNLVFHIFGVSDYSIRLGSALFGIAGFFWIWKMRYWLGEVGTWFTLLFYSLSPGLTFYQRFFREDAMFVFNTLWIIASLANWWRTRDGRWAASAVFGITVIFCNKESSLFVYFSIVTFVALLVIHDLVAHLLEGRSRSVRTHIDLPSSLPSPGPIAFATLVILVLVITQIFEGITYDGDVKKAIGHDWVLSNISSIPVMLGWERPTEATAPDAGPAIMSLFWVALYGGAFVGTLIGARVLRTAIKRHIGYHDISYNLYERIWNSRNHIAGALAGSVAIYLLIFTTLLKYRIGFFEIYERTWAYWGGQHEWGRIAGPFHQHLANIAIYEAPSMLIVLGAWIYLLFRVPNWRSVCVSFWLMILAVGAFHKVMFSGLEFSRAGAVVPMGLDFLKNIFFGGVAAGLVGILFPKANRVIVPLAFFAFLAYFIYVITGSSWLSLQDQLVYKHGAPVEMMGRHINLRDYIEVQLNFDAGWNLLLVLALVFFATLHTWVSLQQGDRFHAFLIWWTVTSYGAASYAREAVPQVGIHAMLPLIMLAGSYVQKLALNTTAFRRPGTYVVIGLLAVWSLKATAILNFTYADDPRERMVYGPNTDDVRSQMDMIREYGKIASLKMGPNNVPVYVTSYNQQKQFKDVKIFLKPIDSVSWSAKWYLRDLEYTEGGDPTTAIKEKWHFIFVTPEDIEKFPSLKTDYNLMRGRGTVFWMPNSYSAKSLTDIWKEWIPGHYLDGTTQAGEAAQSKQNWYGIWRYLIFRDTFEGSDRPVPSVSSINDYVFCARKDLF